MSGKTKLVMHVGLPKTGSCAFQIWCHRNREALRRRGVDFPQTNGVPKHQFLSRALRVNRMDRLERILADSDANTILLSTEAFTNRLYDFRPAALESFRRVTCNHDVTVFMVTRDLNAWRRSYYKRMVITPPSPEFYWGTALEYDDFCLLDRVQRLCNVAALEEDLRAAFGATVVVARYEGGWMNDFLSVLGVRDVADLHPMTRENVSVSDDVAELIRQVNAMGLPVPERAHFIRALKGAAQVAGDSLKFFYPTVQPSGESAQDASSPIDRVLNRLRPRTAVQAEWIEQLRQQWCPDPVVAK